MSTVSRGTVRAVDTGDTNGRLRTLADDITTVRERLDTLVDELDRRRHAALDLRGHARRHVREIALGALALVAVAGAVVAYRAGWLDSSRIRRRGSRWLSASSMRRRFRRG